MPTRTPGKPSEAETHPTAADGDAALKAGSKTTNKNKSRLSAAIEKLWDVFQVGLFITNYDVDGSGQNATSRS